MQTEMSLTVALQDIKCTNILEVAYFYYELSIEPTVASGFHHLHKLSGSNLVHE